MSIVVTANLVDQVSGAKFLASKTITPTDDQHVGRTLTVGTTEVDLDHSSDISTPGYVWCINRGSTDTISVGFATTDYDFELKPGYAAIFPIKAAGSARLFVKSSGTADSDNFEYRIQAA